MTAQRLFRHSPWFPIPGWRDDLAVCRLEVEAKLAGLVLADLELACDCSSPPRKKSSVGNFGTLIQLLIEADRARRAVQLASRARLKYVTGVDS